MDLAPCGCRGVVAMDSIPLEDVEAAPLVAVPEKLYMTTGHADAVLEAAGAAGSLPAAARLAMLLAHESARGNASPWWPYIASLPPRGSCAWLMGPAELRSVIGCLPEEEVEEALKAVRGAAASMEALAERCSGIPAGRRLGLDAQSMTWALGQVRSVSSLLMLW